MLGVTFEAYDVGKRQGAVDAFLHYPDGRRAAFEVMWLAAHADKRLDGQLRQAGDYWPTTGRGRRNLKVDARDDVRRLRKVYDRAILACEAERARKPVELDDTTHDGDPELRWLAEEAHSTLREWPALPSRPGPNVVLVRRRW